MMLHNAEELVETVCRIGALPFFKCVVPGFSIDEMTPRDVWFVEGVSGPWEWKSPAIKSGECCYGKFFRGKTGYVSRTLLPLLINHRRDGYDYDAAYDDGLMPACEKQVMDVLTAEGPLLSTELKEKCGYGRNGKKGFERVITSLQIKTYAVCSDFEYAVDGNGGEYGWGIAKYAAPEQIYGADFCRSAYSEQPRVSFEKLITTLRENLPGTDEKLLKKLMK